MSVKKALVTGVLGQDGIFLSRLLLSKGYSVLGTFSGSASNNLHNAQFLPKQVRLKGLNNLTSGDLQNFLKEENPNEIYNLSALSSVRESFEYPEDTKRLNESNPIEVFNFIAREMPEVKVFQAGSSEMYGVPKVSPQNELTEFGPKSPYAVSKANTFQEIVQLRENGLFAVNGIMYNHESEYRGENFVSRKITKNIARILLKKQDGFSLGDMSITRDWGYAKDYVNAMWLALQIEKPQDYVIATGVSRSLYEFAREALDVAGLNGEIDAWITSDPSLYRKNEITNLTGDVSKAREQLGWTATTPFRTWIGRMIENDLEVESQNPS